MGVKKFFYDLDLRKKQLLQARFQNVTNAQQTTLAGELTSSHKGLIIYNTDLGKVYIWSGSLFTEITQSISIGTYRGSVAHDALAPSSPNTGDWVVFSSAGTATNFGGAVVEPQDLAFYNGTTWDIVQANLTVATDTVAGKVRKATDAEASAGDDVTAFVTPIQLYNIFGQKSNNFAVNLVANTPYVLTHNINDAAVGVRFTIQSENTDSEFYFERTDANSITITSPETVDVFVYVFSTKYFA